MKFTTIIQNLFLLVLLLSQSAQAQSGRPTAPGKIGLTLSTEGSSSGEARLKGGDETFKDVQISRASWSIAQSFAQGSSGALSLSFSYDRTAIDEGNRRHHERDYSADRVPLPNELQSLGVALEFSTQVNERWSFSASAGAASNVAKHDLLSKGWGVNAHALGLYRVNPDFTFAVGLAYNSLSDDWKLVPILGFDWRLTEKWSVALGLPKTAVSYAFNDRLTLALAASGSGGTFHIEEDPRPGVAPRTLADSKLEYTEVRLGVEAAWKINDTFRLSGTVGHVVYRKFEYIDRDYQLKSRDAVPFLSLAFVASL